MADVFGSMAAQSITRAEEMWRAETAYSNLREVLFDDILKILLIDPSDPDSWPFNDFTHDDYDASFELKEVRNDFRIPDLALSSLWELGFYRCWLCHQDGTETYYYKQDK